MASYQIFPEETFRACLFIPDMATSLTDVELSQQFETLLSISDDRMPRPKECDLATFAGWVIDGNPKSFSNSDDDFPMTVKVGSSSWLKITNIISISRRWFQILSKLSSFQGVFRSSSSEILSNYMTPLPCFHDNDAVANEAGLVTSETFPIRSKRRWREELSRYQTIFNDSRHLKNFDDVVILAHWKQQYLEQEKIKASVTRWFHD
ncbi:hypothetical protein K491DRAFT_129494 [Lophiostoma macrostomum CBS 122681]|uniref:Uncharacterized protein n=1 Tax=Lophiostoma macrostomum CBS 122681 TaxID=1314788 RepID=A0A6A6STU5_9PLEO|nr:hypothetical protein K491DRAFT_129494 [Lophiostoma macrostomum CBS 122681]